MIDFWLIFDPCWLPKSNQKCYKIWSKINQKINQIFNWFFIDFCSILGANLGVLWGSGGHLLVVLLSCWGQLGPTWSNLGQLGANLGQLGANLGQLGANLSLNWGQDSNQMAQEAQRCHSTAQCGLQFGSLTPQKQAKHWGFRKFLTQLPYGTYLLNLRSTWSNLGPTKLKFGPT